MFMIQKLAYFKKQMPENMCSPMTRITKANQYVYPCLYRKNHIAPINDDFGIMLATAQHDTIGAVTVKPI